MEFPIPIQIRSEIIVSVLLVDISCLDEAEIDDMRKLVDEYVLL